MGSRKKQWSQEEERKLFSLHKEYGNKWAVIAAIMPGKDDSCIKNKFYSTLRKGLRKVNSYVTNVKKKADPIKYKAFKPFPELFLTKIIAVVDRNHDEKFEVKPRAIELASSIQERIAQLAYSQTEYVKPQQQSYVFEQELLSHIQQFNKNCKKRKGKRKNIDGKEDGSINQESPFVAEKMEQSLLIDQLNEAPKQLKKQSISKPKKIEESIPQVDTKGSIAVSEQALTVSGIAIPIPLNTSMQKRRSMSTTVISNDSAQFAYMAGQFFKVMEDNSIDQSNNLSVSSSWISQGHTQKGRYMLHPSPLPSSDTYSPFNLNNRNVTLSSQLDDKPFNSIDLFSSGRLQTKREYSVVSLLDQIPHYEVNRANFLVRSSDIQSSAKLAESGNCKDSIASASHFQPKLKSDYSLNLFLAGLDVKDFKGMPIEEKMSQYEFGYNNWSAKTSGEGNKNQTLGSKCLEQELVDRNGRVGDLNKEHG